MTVRHHEQYEGHDPRVGRVYMPRHEVFTAYNAMAELFSASVGENPDGVLVMRRPISTEDICKAAANIYKACSLLDDHDAFTRAAKVLQFRELDMGYQGKDLLHMATSILGDVAVDCVLLPESRLDANNITALLLGIQQVIYKMIAADPRKVGQETARQSDVEIMGGLLEYFRRVFFDAIERQLLELELSSGDANETREQQCARIRGIIEGLKNAIWTSEDEARQLSDAVRNRLSP